VNRTRGWLLGGLLSAALLAAGCSAMSGLGDDCDADRFERVNRAVYGFNRGLDRKLVRPLARGYDRIVPGPVDRRFRNFFTNLRAPGDIVNNMLQGKFLPGFSDLGRFLFNSTAGLAGFFDPASKVGLHRHAEDFGQTLAVWGVPQGSYLVLPLIGPSTVRDAVGWAFDTQTDLLVQHSDSSARYTLLAWRAVSDRVGLLIYERQLEQAFDEYVYAREAYLQRRRYDIFDGNPPDEDELWADDVAERTDARARSWCAVNLRLVTPGSPA
jgi:phospholipid-binding lipoprotein MlaA